MIDLNRRLLTQALLTSLGSLVLPACGGGGGDGDKPEPSQDSAEFSVFPDANDPRIVEGALPGNEKFVLYGAKDASGRIVAPEEMQFLDAAMGVTQVRYESTGSRLVANSDDSSFSVAASGNAGLIVGLVAGERQLELNLANVFQAKAAQSSFSEPLAHGTSGRMGRALVLGMSAAGCGCVAGASTEHALADTVHAPIVEVMVSGCVGDNPSVRVVMRDEAGKVLDVVTAKKAGGGLYNAVLTNLNTPDEAMADAAEAVITFLDEFDVTEGAFVYLFKKINSMSIDALAEEVIQYLESAGKAADTMEEFAPYLNLTDQDITQIQKRAKFKVFLGKKLGLLVKSINAWDKLFAALLAGDALSKIANAYGQYKFNQLQLQPQVTTSSGVKVIGTASGLIPPDGPYPQLSVAAPASTEISALTLTPASPAAGQDYVAEGSVSCAVAGDQVSIRVVGSDGYTDTVSSMSSSSETQAFHLTVPGANSGVHDVVTLWVTRGGTTVSTRTANLLFAS